MNYELRITRYELSNTYKVLIGFVLMLFSSSVLAQDILLKDSAVAITLEQNYGIKIAKNSLQVAKNNTSIYNSNYLPKITVRAGTNYANANLDYEYQDGTTSSVDGSSSLGYNASIGVAYTLFDGLGRSHTYKKWKESYNLSQLEARQIVESTLLQLFLAYYGVANLTESENNLQSSIVISENRLLRTKYNFDYGKSTKLDVLNAEVDLNNDKIRHFAIKSQLVNAKHNLNLILGRDIKLEFVVDTSVVYNELLIIDDLINSAKQKNVSLQKANKNLEISNYTLKENKSLWMPRVDLTGSYGFAGINYNEKATYAYSSNLGLNAGLNLTWNVFDGGMTKTRLQNTQIAIDNIQIQLEQTEQILERDMTNLWESYQNALFVLQAEMVNLQTANLSFSRSEEQFKLALISSIEFRIAQLNLLNAKTNLTQAKFDAKNIELQLLQLSGLLLEAKY